MKLVTAFGCLVSITALSFGTAALADEGGGAPGGGDSFGDVSADFAGDQSFPDCADGHKCPAFRTGTPHFAEGGGGGGAPSGGFGGGFGGGGGGGSSDGFSNYLSSGYSSTDTSSSGSSGSSSLRRFTDGTSFTSGLPTTLAGPILDAPVAPIPEPSELALLAVGLVTVMARVLKGKLRRPAAA